MFVRAYVPLEGSAAYISEDLNHCSVYGAAAAAAVAWAAMNNSE